MFYWESKSACSYRKGKSSLTLHCTIVHACETGNIELASSRTFSVWRTSWFCLSYMNVCFVSAFSAHRVLSNEKISVLRENL
jgi:hypothetical protein